MLKRILCTLLVVIFLSVVLAFLASAQGNPAPGGDKQLSEKMLRFGKEAYLRGKYEEAKAYFRKAIEADPKSQSAWIFYDISSVMALGKKVEKQTDLLATTQVPPSGPEKAQPEASPPSPTAPVRPEGKPPSTKEAPKPEFKIMHDEGC